MSNVPVVFLILLSAVLSVELQIATPVIEMLAGAIGENVFHLEIGDELRYLSNLGLLTLMFLAGLELDLHRLKSNIREPVMLGASSFFVPFIPISVLTYLYSNNFYQALFIATALSTTAVAIVYPILREARFLAYKKGQTLYSATVVLDLLTLVILSFLVFEFTLSTLIAVPLLIVLLYFTPDLSRSLLKRYRDVDAEIELRFILLLLLGISALSEYGNIDVALTAFFLGAFTSEAFKHHEGLEKKLRSLAFGFLTPFFYFVAGSTIDFKEVLNYLPQALALFALSFSLKFLGSYLPTKKIQPEHARYVGFLFANQLTLGIIAATIGFHAGHLNQGVYSMLVIIVLATSIVSSFAIGRKKCGLDMICE
ncbi:MAG: cation:proton antiporter [Candidatus Altiarchaeota archaeon]